MARRGHNAESVTKVRSDGRFNSICDPVRGHDVAETAPFATDSLASPNGVEGTRGLMTGELLIKKVRKQSGFTLVELLIVAIILAVLAAIVIPQFASTTDDAQDSALRANLASIRGAIEFYRQQHNANPSATDSSGGTCTGGTAGTGATKTQAALEEQLTRYTNASGQSCSLTVGGSFQFGPYFKDDALPANPVTGSSVAAIVDDGNLEMVADGAGLGWKYDVTSGKFIANDTNLDSGGQSYDSY